MHNGLESKFYFLKNICAVPTEIHAMKYIMWSYLKSACLNLLSRQKHTDVPAIPQSITFLYDCLIKKKKKRQIVMADGLTLTSSHLVLLVTYKS